MADPYLGQIIIFAGNYAPINWAFCNGQSLPIQSYAALYAVIGTAYGGDGVSNFNLPDLRSRVPVHFGQGTGLAQYALGQKSGAENATLNQPNMPIHNHTFSSTGTTVGIQAGDAAGTSSSASGNYLCNSGDTQSPGVANGYGFAPAASAGALGNLAGTSINFGASAIGNAGGSQPFPILPPSLALNFIIALQGIFPARP